jgi:general secretion pathway protein A
MYEEFYGLKDKPFQIVPNPEYLYLSSKHKNALTYLEYGVTESSGFVLLTGEIGSGKTTLIRYLLKQIESDMEVAVIFNTNVTSDELLSLIVQEFELGKEAGGKAKNLEILNRFLVGKYAEKKRVLLIIDEAQNLTDDGLEEVRMLSNVQSDDQILLQIMLVGQPELRARLKTAALAQFSQRIAVNYHLQALTAEETCRYIVFRLKKAGATSAIFTADAAMLIYRESGGIPRMINLICDSALIYGFADEIRTIDAQTIGSVIEELRFMGAVGEIPSDAAGAGDGEDEKHGDGFLRRLEMLEAKVQVLDKTVQDQIRELEKRTSGYRDELVTRLKELVIVERKRSNSLLCQYTNLKSRYEALQRIRAAPKTPKTEQQK